jgi:hypothetical protein
MNTDEDIALLASLENYRRAVAARRADNQNNGVDNHTPPDKPHLVADPRSSLAAAARFYWNAHLQQRRST